MQSLREQIATTKEYSLEISDYNRLAEKLDFTLGEKTNRNIEIIKKACINYGLKFLPISEYGREIPKEKLESMVKYKEAHEGRVKFFILAPQEHFVGPKLIPEKKDPFIFARHGDYESKDYRYVADWGNDFGLWRRITALKRRNFRVARVAKYFWVILLLLAVGASLHWWYHTWTPPEIQGFLHLVTMTIELATISLLTINFDTGFSKREYNHTDHWNSKKTL